MPTNKADQFSTFCWNQLATPNVDEAIVFYTALFGWDVIEEDLADGGTTVRLSHHGEFVAGVHLFHGGDARWEPFLLVDNIPDVLVRVSEHLGQVLEADVSAGAHGTLATISSPSGTQVCLWKAGRFPGQGLINENNVPTWHTLLASNLAVEHAFWANVMGWENVHEGSDTEQGIFQHPSNGNIANSRTPQEEMKPTLGELDCRWVPHIQVSDCDQTIEAAKTIGAEVLLEAEDVPNVGRQAFMVDPLGGVFGIYTPKVI